MATEKTTQRRAVLSRIILQRGPSTRHSNLQRVLDALWEVADENHQVQRAVFKPVLLRLRQYFEELAAQGCLDIVYEALRGNPLEKLVLKKRDVPAEESVVSAPPRRTAPETRSRAQSAMVGHTSGHVLIPSPRCLIFIDAPNLYNMGKHLVTKGCLEEMHFLNFFRTKWEEFRQIGVEITGIPLERQTCFLYTTVLCEYGSRFTEKCDRISESGIRIRTRERKDIDLYLATDLMREAFSYITNRRKIHIVIVSGDSDYAYTLKNVRESAQEAGADVQISAIAWSQATSFELKEVSDRTYMAEESLRRLDPTGAENWLNRYNSAKLEQEGNRIHRHPTEEISS